MTVIELSESIELVLKLFQALTWGVLQADHWNLFRERWRLIKVTATDVVENKYFWERFVILTVVDSHSYNGKPWDVFIARVERPKVWRSRRLSWKERKERNIYDINAHEDYVEPGEWCVRQIGWSFPDSPLVPDSSWVTASIAFRPVEIMSHGVRMDSADKMLWQETIREVGEDRWTINHAEHIRGFHLVLNEGDKNE